ncbi:hypothetical protein ISN45_At03g036040 [Arabidopsis thaliana x Arabidopsis arenosa]|uniref:Uncharacterized protein n=2 Tax=Arabidopsis TaxID=3701 RepID=A0A8T2FAU0_ARASU|nr:hypothetical protein ISN45_At03g036040 [Arabidopsis thaliana x Arabidopsis arenosa]KAG7633217.1 hypothetical protein ISN44_As03g035010 [Arabidopsis suecica]
MKCWFLVSERSALIVIGGGRCYLRVGRGHPW